MASKQQARHRGLYDRKCRGATLDVEDLVLVKQTAWKGRHKIQDPWEEEEYQVVDQPTPGVPVYVVKSIAGGRPRVLHRNLLLPLQGRIRQEGVTREESSPDSESEGEAPEAPRATCGRPRRSSHVTSTRKRGAPIHLSGDSHPTLPSMSSPEPMTGDEDSSEDEGCITPSKPVDSPHPLLRQWRMTGSQLHLNLPLTCLVMSNPYLIRQSMMWMWIVYKSKSQRVNQRVTLIVPYLQHQEGVPGVPKAYLQCAMDRYRSKVPSYQNCKNLPGIGRFYMFPAINR